jgi:hypothetical protein
MVLSWNQALKLQEEAGDVVGVWRGKKIFAVDRGAR